MLAYREDIKKVAAATLRVVPGVEVHTFELGPDHRKQRRCAHLRG
jgi:DNA integrity scanning protein DisA with diadenylate cyclase activity